MFTKDPNVAALNAEIAFSLEELKKHRDDPEKYSAIVERIVKLEKLKPQPGLRPPSLDTVLVVGGNLFAILWLTRFEREHVIPSKNALGFVMKPKM